MDLSNYTSEDTNVESLDSSVIKRVAILAFITIIGLELTSHVFKLDRDLGQIVVFPVVLVTFVYSFKRILPIAVKKALLSLLILLIFSVLWTQGEFGLRGVSYISRRLLGSSNLSLEKMRVEFNRDSEVLNFPKLETIYRNFDDRSADRWGRGSFRLLVYADPLNPRLKLFLKSLSGPQEIEYSGAILKISLFPEWVPVDPRGIPVDYLTTLTRVLPSLNQQKDRLQQLEDLGFAGYAAGLSGGRWNSPVPRAAALLLGASSNLAKGENIGTTALKCIRRELLAVIKKTRMADSPELRAMALNNLAVTNLLLNYKDHPNKSLSYSRRLLSQATRIRSADGHIVYGAKLATYNLFTLEGTGLTSTPRKKHRTYRRRRSRDHLKTSGEASVMTPVQKRRKKGH